MTESFDLAVVGGGILGLTTARSIHRRHPAWSIVVLEKEREVGVHQTGHNSGVVHSGVYYRPGSLKARLTFEGRAALLDFAAREGIPTRPIGKVIVAQRRPELAALAELLARARANGVDSVRRLTVEELRARLPGVAGVGALDVPSAAIIDYPTVARTIAARLRQEAVTVRTTRELTGADAAGERWELRLGGEGVRARFVVNCAGLESDLVARAMGARPTVVIVPFRGDYYRLSERVRAEVPCLVYPVPDPDLPFLGVHLTPTMRDELLLGPNAALALAREGYSPGHIDLRDVGRMLSFRGTAGLARRYAGLAAREWLRSWSPRAYLETARKLWPGLERHDLRSRSSGVRAQAVRSDGTLEDDFVFARGPHALHVLNAPSPAATASFAIAERVADAIEEGAPELGRI